MTVHKRFLHIAPEADSVIQAQSVMRHFCRQFQIVGNHDDGHAQLPVDVFKHSVQFDFSVGVHSRCRFVQQQKFGLGAP